MTSFRESRKILSFYKLPVTQSRLEILHAFLCAPAALDQGAIARYCTYKPDRATIYRNLQVLVARGVLHTVPSADTNVYYALHPPDAHQEAHLHFFCIQCRELTCIPEAPVPETRVPEGFEASGGDMILKGVCRKCRQGS